VASTVVIPRPRNGFKRLYYLTTPDHAISNIAFKRLKLSRLSELNDPFELLGASFRDEPGFRNLVEKHKEVFDQTHGLICFSEKWRDPVLWGHYAAKHRGVALGFDVDISLIKKVEYNSDRIKSLHPGPSSISPDFTEMLLITKFSSWKYEREWRVFISLKKKDTYTDGELYAYAEGALYFVPFSKALTLVEVILGPLCNLDLERTRHFVDSFSNNVITFKSRLAHWSFKVIPQSEKATSIQSYQSAARNGTLSE
jgi:hypothetical protein